MADESAEHRDPSLGRSSHTGNDHEGDQASRAANRRRIIVTSLLTPPDRAALRPTPGPLQLSTRLGWVSSLTAAWRAYRSMSATSTCHQTI